VTPQSDNPKNKPGGPRRSLVRQLKGEPFMMTHDPFQSYQFGTYPLTNNPYMSLGPSPYGVNPQQLIQQQIAQQLQQQQLQQYLQQQQLLASLMQNPILASLLHTHHGQGFQQNPFQQNPFQQNPLQQSPFQQFGSPLGQQFGSPYGQQFGSPYGQQFGSPYGQQFGSPFGQTGYPLAPQTLGGGWIGARGPWSY
jgi:hypothetical protein